MRLAAAEVGSTSVAVIATMMSEIIAGTAFGAGLSRPPGLRTGERFCMSRLFFTLNLRLAQRRWIVLSVCRRVLQITRTLAEIFACGCWSSSRPLMSACADRGVSTRSREAKAAGSAAFTSLWLVFLELDGADITG